MKKVHNENELVELNKGIILTRLKTDKEEQIRLRSYLLQSKEKIEKHVIKGTIPSFGYPPICYSPQNKEKAYLTPLMNHIFS